jgi:hypothetical protein
MDGKLKKFGLVSAGAVAGVLISLGITAVAQRDARSPLPLEELRQFSDVFGAIKANYVENVEDKKLITEAISGMLSGSRPALGLPRRRMPSRNCRSAPRVNSAASASRSASRTASSRSFRRSRTPRPPRRHQARAT